MRHSLLSLLGLDPLRPLIVYGEDNDGGGGRDRDRDRDRDRNVGAGGKFSDGATSLGSVSASGQYAGDGYEWVQNEGTNVLTRRYTGANTDAGLGTDVRTAGTSDKDVKETIAKISLDEGTEFAGSRASSTDDDFLSFVFTGDSGGSDSYADQVGVPDYTPVISYDPTLTGSVNEAIRSASAATAPPDKSFGEVFNENLEA